jgi:antagonist of KipI
MTALCRIRVLAPGLHSLLVDQGRPAYRSLGLPVGGAADAFSLAIGNALVGNPATLAALEITLAGPTLRLPSEAPSPVACVVYGAPFDLTIQRGEEEQPLQAGTTFTLQPGDELHIGGTARGARAYLCLAGGFQTPVILGSRSALHPLQAGEDLPCFSGQIGGRFVEIPEEEEQNALHVLPGGQASWFRPEAFASPGGESSPAFTISPSSNRMGLRLQGPPLDVPDREMVSEPVCPGTVQVTRNGQCIVLGVDGQTIGGYPKIAQVIRADLDRLGQLRPGQRVSFRWVDLDEAELRAWQRQRLLREWISRLLA